MNVFKTRSLYTLHLISTVEIDTITMQLWLPGAKLAELRNLLK